MRWLSIALTLYVSSYAAPAIAQEPTATSSTPQSVTGSVDAFRGLYSESVPIAAPAFHGLEPKLALTYSSSATTDGFAGLGWSLGGVSTIERATPGKGAPHYDGNDLFLLDGEILSPCASGSVSPSCTTGGTHSTKIETYSRVKYDPASDTWTITQKNGTKSVYSPVYVVSAPVQVCSPNNPTASGSVSVPYTDPTTGTQADEIVGVNGGTVAGFSFTGYSLAFSSFVQLPDIALGGGVSTYPTPFGGSAPIFDVQITSSNTLTFIDYNNNQTQLMFQNTTLGGFGYATSSPNGITSITGAGNVITFSDGVSSGTVTLNPVVTCQTVYENFTYRYGLTSVSDTSGNTVHYNWACDPGADCYLDTVTYNRATIKLYRESRPDPISFANGAYVGRTNYRLKTIDVLVQDSDNVTKRVRVYKLTYDTSASSARSRLLSVQHFGRDASVDSSGTVSGGTSLPAAGFGYSTAALTANAADYVLGSLSGAGVGTGVPTYSMGDFNGDGKADFGYREGNGRTMHVVTLVGSSAVDQVWGSMALDPGSSPFEGGYGDFDGDGKTDFMYRANNTRDLHVLLSTGTGFATDAYWGTKAADIGTGLVQQCIADFNGDGKSDFLYRQANSGNLRVVLSGGAGFVSDAAWGVEVAAVGIGPFEGGCADFNGDGKADYLYRESNSGNLHVLISNGSSFNADTVWGTKAADAGTGPYEGGMVDLNGDGKADYVYRAANTQTLHVLLSTGNGFAADAAWGSKSQAAGTGPYEGGWADVNADGLNDYVYRAGNTSQFYVLLSTGVGFEAEQPWLVHGAAQASSGPNDMPLGGFADFNGDGRTDYIYMAGSTVHGAGSPAAIPDLLTSVTNGYGGTITLAYTPSSAWVNTNGVPLVQTLTTQTIADGRGGVSTTTYGYAGGLWDPIDRKFHGFHYAKMTLPCITGETACPYTETWFKQDYGSVSKPERVDRRDGAGTLLASDQPQYTTNGATLPYQSLETGRWVYAYDSTGGSRRTFVARSYDNLGFDSNNNPVWSAGYANVTLEVLYGDYDLSGDEKTVRYVYVPNSTAYVVGKPAVIDTFAGTSAQGALLAESLIYYDNATTWNAAPTLGRPTQTFAWLNTTNSYVSAATAYDAYGNVTSETDRAGAVTLSEYDTTFHQYLTKKTNALNQVATAQWDAVCAAKSYEIDANLQQTTFHTDALCRPIEGDLPGGGYTKWSYVNTGDPNNQYTQMNVPAPDGTDNLWTRVYEDGLGRTWRTLAKGAVAGKDITVDIQFNARGAKAQVSAPYFTGDTPQWTVTDYDAIDRPTRITHPDGNFVTRDHRVDRTITTDELGHAMTDQVDVLGHVTSHDETVGGVTRATLYAYDVRGYPTTITDAANNKWTFTVDSLGRKTQVVDPDAGTTAFSYDAADRLTTQQNALWSAHYAYDPLGRKTSRATQNLDGTGAQTVTWRYDEARPNYFNIGRLTTMTDAVGQSTYNYDAVGRTVDHVRVIDGVSYEQTTAFDTGGRALWTQYPDGDTLGSATSPLVYDGAGRLRAIPGVVNEADYDAAGRLTTINNANNTTTTVQYSATRAWVTNIHSVAGSIVIQSLDYSNRDAGGKLLGVTSPFAGESWSYHYDELNRLTSATVDPNTVSADTQTVSYDPFGNITNNSRLGSYIYGGTAGAGPHAVTQAGSLTYAYDAVGNMISGAGRTITYDPTGMPVNINGIALAYDGNGRRIKKTVGSVSTTYLDDDLEVQNGQLTKYVSIGNMLVGKRVGLTPYWLHVDQQNSIRAVTDSNGNVVQRQAYRPYGERLSTATTYVESRGFTGQRQDETGLFYLHARYYDPQLARFVSPDPTFPSAQTAALNRYAYAHNDPVDQADIDGLGAFNIIHTIFNYASFAINVIAPGAGAFLTYASYVMSAATAANAGIHGGLKAFLVAAGGEAISQVTGELTQGVGKGLDKLERLAIHSAIAFASGFVGGVEGGQSPGQALKDAAVSTGISAAESLGSMSVEQFKQSALQGQAASTSPQKPKQPKVESDWSPNLASGTDSAHQTQLYHNALKNWIQTHDLSVLGVAKVYVFMIHGDEAQSNPDALSMLTGRAKNQKNAAVILLSCESGATDKHGQSVGAERAKALNINVYAPNMIMGFDNKGAQHFRTEKQSKYSDDPAGHFILFTPQGTQTPMDHSWPRTMPP